MPHQCRERSKARKKYQIYPVFQPTSFGKTRSVPPVPPVQSQISSMPCPSSRRIKQSMTMVPLSPEYKQINTRFYGFPSFQGLFPGMPRPARSKSSGQNLQNQGFCKSKTEAIGKGSYESQDANPPENPCPPDTTD